MNKIEKLAIYLITAYQRTISPDHGVNPRATCRFTPTCSEYTKTAIQGYGLWGITLGTWRIIRCNPLMTKAGTVETVPEKIGLGKLTIRKKR